MHGSWGDSCVCMCVYVCVCVCGGEDGGGGGGDEEKKNFSILLMSCNLFTQVSHFLLIFLFFS